MNITSVRSCAVHEKKPAVASTIYLPDAIDYDLFINRFEATTFDFSEGFKVTNKRDIELKKSEDNKSIVVKVSNNILVMSGSGNLAFDADCYFYLPYKSNPSPHYLVNFSIQAAKLILTELKKITQGFVNTNKIYCTGEEFEAIRKKWAKVVLHFVNSTYENI